MANKIRTILEQYKRGEIAIHVAEKQIEQPLWDIWNGLVNGDYGIGKAQSDAVDPIMVSDAISRAMGWMADGDDIQERRE